MPTGSDHAWNAQGELGAIDRDAYPDHIKARLEEYIEELDDLAAEMQLVEEESG